MARPSRYETEMRPHLDEVRHAVEAGATVEEIAQAFNVHVSTIHAWKARYPEFAAAFARGREKVVIEIKATLLKKALGFEYEEEKRVGKKDATGESIILVEKYKRYCVPSETAAAMLLRNYDKEWLDRDQATTDMKKQETELRKKIAEANNFDFEV